MVIDLPILSDPLPGKKEEFTGLEGKLLRNQMFELVCYIAQKEREKIFQRTKEGLKHVKEFGSKTGNPVGKPRSKWSTKENFIKTIEYMLKNNVGQAKASLMCKYPTKSFQNDIKKCYEKYNAKDYQEILNNIKEDTTDWKTF